MSDPVNDTFGDRLEETIRDLLLARSELDPLKVIYRGEPSRVPVKLYPYGVVFLATEGEAAGEDGYTADTGPVIYLRYDGYVAFSVLVPDTSALMPDVDRKADIPSYLAAKEFAQAAKQEIKAWGGITRDFMPTPVVSQDGKETSSQLRTDEIRNAVETRPFDENVENTSRFDFHIMSRREEFP